MILVLIVIILIITFFSAFVNFQLSRKISIQEESVERLKQEKLIVVNFMHSISGAIIGEKTEKNFFRKLCMLQLPIQELPVPAYLKKKIMVAWKELP